MLRGLFAKRWTATQTKVSTQLSRLPNSTIWGGLPKTFQNYGDGCSLFHFSLIAETQHRHSQRKPMFSHHLQLDRMAICEVLRFLEASKSTYVSPFARLQKEVEAKKRGNWAGPWAWDDGKWMTKTCKNMLKQPILILEKVSWGKGRCWNMLKSLFYMPLLARITERRPTRMCGS